MANGTRGSFGLSTMRHIVVTLPPTIFPRDTLRASGEAAPQGVWAGVIHQDGHLATEQ